MNHYQKHPSGIECIQIAKHESFNIGNVIKYIWRRNHKKHALQDLEKARYYLDQEISILKTTPQPRSLSQNSYTLIPGDLGFGKPPILP